MKNDPYLGRYFTVPVSSSCMNRYHKRHQLGTLSLSFFSVFNFYVESSFFSFAKKKTLFCDALIVNESMEEGVGWPKWENERL